MSEHRVRKQKQLKKKIAADVYFRGRNPLHDQVLTIDEVVELCNLAKTERIYQIRVGVLGKRDAALIAMLYSFGKRITEILTLKRDDIEWDDEFLYVHFTVQKKEKRDQLKCLTCNTVTSSSARYCRKCGEDLKELGKTIPARKKLNVYRKMRPLDYPLIPFILEWVKKVPQGGYVFAPANTGCLFERTIKLDFTRHINRIRGWCIVDGYDLESSPHFFRHSLATNLAEEGFDDLELCDWFDWESVESARDYTSRAGTKRVRRIAKSKV